MKKLVMLTVVAIYLLGLITVSANNLNFSTKRDMLIELSIVDEVDYWDSNTITREESLIAIMRVIGLTDNDVNMMDGADCYAFVDAGPFTYIGCAYLARIAYGVECVVDFPTYRSSHTGKNTDYFFFPERDATITEVLAFMIRCLEKDEIDLDTAVEKAYQYGLLNAEDIFNKHLDSPISRRDFSILLNRMLQQKRYKYFVRENNLFDMSGKVDEKRTISYIDMLKQRM